MSDAAVDVAEVRLFGIPVDLRMKASEHHDGLRREFRLLTMEGHGDPNDVPARLLSMAEDLDRMIMEFAASTQRQLDEAVARGEQAVNLEMNLPTAIAPALREFIELMREVDRYCTEGEHLLSLASPPDVLFFREWILGEIVSQIGGAPPRPWPGTPPEYN